MSHDTSGPEDAVDSSDDDYVDIEEDLEEGPKTEKQGFFSRTAQKLGNAKDRYTNFHTTEEPNTGVGGTNISRRGFVTGVGELAVAGFAVAEATDGDGLDIDWNENGEAPAGGGVAPPPGEGNETDTTTPGDQNYGAAEGLGEGSDRIYLQEDGDLIAVDYGDKEIRRFGADRFPANEDFIDLYEELDGQREATDIPAGYGEGIEVTPNELFEEDREAYDDMADESEWDLIFDENPGYSE